MKTPRPLLILSLSLLLATAPAFARGGGGGGGHGGGGHGHGGTTTYFYFTQTSTAAWCVRESTIVGDAVRLPDGSYKAVSSLRGKTSQCNNPEYPVRVELAPLADYSCVPRLPYNPDAGIDLPEGWVPTRQACKLVPKGYFFLARNEALHGSLLIGSFERKPRADIAAYANDRRSKQMANLLDATATELRQVEIDGRPAWQAEVRGMVASTKKDTTYLLTIIDNGADVVYLNVMLQTDSYLKHKEEIEDLAYNLDGLSDAPASAGAGPLPAPAATLTQPQ